MKRFFAGLLILALLLSLAACGAEAPETTPETTGEDLSLLSATELYARAADATALLSSARWTTQVSGGAEDYSLDTVRVREGYDRFSFSQTKNGTVRGVYFNGDQAWILSEDGNYTAPATTVTFQNFWDSEYFPIGSLSMEHFVNIQRDGMTVTYGEANEAGMAAFGALDAWTVTAVEGEAGISEDLLIEAETIRVTGTLSDGSERQITLRTTLDSHGEGETAAIPALEDETIMEVNDIRLPSILSLGWEGLRSGDVSLALIQEEEVTGAGRYFRYSDGILNRVGADYSLQENLFTGYPGEDGAEISAMLLSQLLAQGSTVRTVTYDKTADGAVIADETTERTATADDALNALLPAQGGFSSATLTEDAQGYSIAITLAPLEARSLAQAALARFSLDAGEIHLDGLTATGTVGFRKSDGALISLSYEISGTTAGGYTVTRRVSFTVETESVALSEIAPPVYLVDEDGHD